jgi:pimeloyl-ACP methyl ester carboxylesterase
MTPINVRGKNTNLIDVGSGPTVLLVHGFPLDHSMWKYQFEPLAKKFRVVCPDLPGFGASESGSPPISMRGWADDLSDLLDVLEIETVTFCGLSMGGYIGWQFWKHHRDRLSGLIACDTRAAADSETVARGRRVSAKAVLAHGTKSLAEAMPSKLFSAQSLQQRENDVQMIRTVIARTDREIVAGAQLAMGQRADATEWLDEIEIPTLFIVGEHDGITPPDEMQENANRVIGSQFMQIPDAGHLPPLENSDVFNLAVMKFLNGL